MLENQARKSIMALEHFAKSDAHAMQYSLIAKSLLKTALSSLEKRELAERWQRTESSSQLFGLIPTEPNEMIPNSKEGMENNAGFAVTGRARERESANKSDGAFGRESSLVGSPGRFGDLDPAFLSLSGSLPRTPDFSYLSSGGFDDDQTFGALNLFPLLETGGHIDLAHYL